MNEGQLIHYQATLWPAACKGMGWNPRDKELRREVRRKLTGERTVDGKIIGGKESVNAMSEDEITQLFDGLRALAAGRDVTAEIISEQSFEETRERNVCKQLVHLIRQRGYADEYVAEVAGWRCREAQVTDWTRLPSEHLTKVLYTVNERARTRDEKAGKADAVVRRGKRKAAACDEDGKPLKKPRAKDKLAARGTTPAAAADAESELVEQPF